MLSARAPARFCSSALALRWSPITHTLSPQYFTLRQQLRIFRLSSKLPWNLWTVVSQAIYSITVTPTPWLVTSEMVYPDACLLASCMSLSIQQYSRDRRNKNELTLLFFFFSVRGGEGGKTLWKVLLDKRNVRGWKWLSKTSNGRLTMAASWQLSPLTMNHSPISPYLFRRKVTPKNWQCSSSSHILQR